MCEKEIFYLKSCLFYTENSRFSKNRPTWVLGRKSATVGSATVGTSPVIFLAHILAVGSHEVQNNKGTIEGHTKSELLDIDSNKWFSVDKYPFAEWLKISSQV